MNKTIIGIVVIICITIIILGFFTMMIITAYFDTHERYRCYVKKPELNRKNKIKKKRMQKKYKIMDGNKDE